MPRGYLPPMKATHVLAGLILLISGSAFAIEKSQALEPMETYRQLRTFTLSQQRIHLNNVSMNRDRIHLIWSGDIYPAAPINGKQYGAVFIGHGQLSVDAWSVFEKASVQRFLKSDHVEVDFTTAVLRFTDDTLDVLTKGAEVGSGTSSTAQKLASELDTQILHETGLNLSARTLAAVANHDTPGFFFAQFSGGKRGTFSALIDHQTTSLQDAFGINGGEKGMLFQYAGVLGGIDIWTTFYDEQDFQNGRVLYSSAFDLVRIPEYRMQIDLREADRWIRNNAEMDLVALRADIQIIPMSLNEALPEINDQRLKKGIRVTAASLSDGQAIGFIQEPWDAGVVLVLPQPMRKDERVTVKLQMQGEHSFNTWQEAFHYPLSTETWYPRHGYLSRSQFDVTFLHKHNTLVASVGERIREEPFEGKDRLTEWKTVEPVALTSFAVGPFERHSDSVTVAGAKIPVEFYSAPSSYAAIKEDFILAELANGVAFFSQLFGSFPYSRLGAVYFPYNFGQGFPTMILLPQSGSAGLRQFSFTSHEISHQWWGDLVAWRSYRDQWLSEGFAEYSAALYASRRDNPKRALDLVKNMRMEIRLPPRTDTGVASGKLYEIGPLTVGHRLSSRRTGGAYSALVYSKGALVLRMLHFLFTDAASGDDQGFYKLMKQFVADNHNHAATTEGFFASAADAFAQSSVGKRCRLSDLNWFLNEWVYGTALPSYRLEYSTEPQPGGATMVSTTLYQEGVADDWVMPLPVVFTFDRGQQARGTICAQGTKTTAKFKLPAQPKQISLDPDLWVLADKTEVSKAK